jgi:membrane fusion protein, adhesin transport system
MAHWKDSEFMADLDAANFRHTNKSSHIILWATVFFLIIFLWWAYFAPIDEVTRGVGSVIPSGQTQIVQNLDGGIISEILVKEGDNVKAGQLLLRIDKTRFSASFNENQLRVQSLKAKIARLDAESTQTEFVPPDDLQMNPEILNNELSLFKSRRDELKSGIAILQEERSQKQQEISELSSANRSLLKSLELAKEEINMKRPLVEKGILPRVEILSIEREATDLEGKIEVNKYTLPRIKTAIDEIDRKIEERATKYRTQAFFEINETKIELARLEEAIRSLEDRLIRTEVTSPVDGIIKQINVNTIGGVIQPGMELIEIVPIDDSLIIEAEIKPQDIAFLHPGQKATIKLTAYDFSIYGGLEATLENISADTITNDTNERVYQIRLRTNKTYLGTKTDSLPIIAGMAADVDILTGNKTIMDYLLKPLRRAQERALRER